MKKILAGGALTAVAMAGLVAMAPTASAHIPNADADCSGLYVDLKSYRGGTNIEIVIDDAVVESATIPGNPSAWGDFVKHYEFSDQTVAHTWSVKVDAHDDDRYDYSDGGTIDACAEPPSKEVVPPATPDVVAGCAVTMDDVILPSNTESVTYSKSEGGVTAALVSDAYIWPEDLGAWVSQPDGSILYPADLLLVAEECEEPTPEPSAPVPSEPAPSEPAPEPSPSAPAEEPAPSPEPSQSAPAAPEVPEDDQLAATGATVGGAAAFALLLVGGGAALVIARRRMAKS